MAINVEMPFEKARQQMAQWRNYAPPLAIVEDREPPEAPNVLVDAVSLGGPIDPKQKPLVRHVIVKDLHKIGTRLKYIFPKGGVFGNKAPMGLYALFDGQSCAGESGPMAAEFCARNFHTKLLERLKDMPQIPADKHAVEAALRGAFEDLDTEIVSNQPAVKDGCGAVVALLIGPIVFTAAVGRCAAVLSERLDGGATFKAIPLSGGPRQVDSDFRRLRQMGGIVVGETSSMAIRHPANGALSRVSRSLGDRDWKNTVVGGPSLILRTPEVTSVLLKDSHPLLLLVTSTVSAALDPQALVDLAGEFQVQPRATCGEIATRAMEARAGSAALSQCTAVEVCFLPEKKSAADKKRLPGASEAQAKKAKVSAAPGGETQSVRLRHIVLKYNDAAHNALDAKSKKVTRSRQDAEAILRRIFFELKKDLRAMKKAPKDSSELVNVTTKKFIELCKEHSECETARKGGTMCGDIGWVTPEDRSKFGGSFKEVVDVLLPGQFSDIAVTEQGAHLVQRIA